MIIKEVYKDLFTVDKDYYLVHCIASDFKMGAGIAVTFQKKYELREKLKQYSGDTSPGSCVLIGKVFNLITKSRSSGKPTYTSLNSSLLNMYKIVNNQGIKKIAMPKIGCGLDRLQWSVVKNIISNVFEDSDVSILICKQ